MKVSRAKNVKRLYVACRKSYKPQSMAEELRQFIRQRFYCRMGTREEWLEVLEVAEQELPKRKDLPALFFENPPQSAHDKGPT